MSYFLSDYEFWIKKMRTSEIFKIITFGPFPETEPSSMVQVRIWTPGPEPWDWYNEKLLKGDMRGNDFLSKEWAFPCHSLTAVPALVAFEITLSKIWSWKKFKAVHKLYPFFFFFPLNKESIREGEAFFPSGDEGGEVRLVSLLLGHWRLSCKSGVWRKEAHVVCSPLGRLQLVGVAWRVAPSWGESIDLEGLVPQPCRLISFSEAALLHASSSRDCFLFLSAKGTHECWSMSLSHRGCFFFNFINGFNRYFFTLWFTNSW